MSESFSWNDPRRIDNENKALREVIRFATKRLNNFLAPTVMTKLAEDVKADLARSIGRAIEGVMRRNLEQVILYGAKAGVSEFELKGEQAFLGWLNLNNLPAVDPKDSFVWAELPMESTTFVRVVLDVESGDFMSEVGSYDPHSAEYVQAVRFVPPSGQDKFGSHTGRSLHLVRPANVDQIDWSAAWVPPQYSTAAEAYDDSEAYANAEFFLRHTQGCLTTLLAGANIERDIWRDL